jgi:hypothetical protein
LYTLFVLIPRYPSEEGKGMAKITAAQRLQYARPAEGDTMSRRSPTVLVAGTAHLVGARLKQKRLEAGLTLKEVSSLTGIPVSSVSRFERGIYQATVVQIEVLATAVRCTTTELLAAGPEGGGSFGAT